jgi:DNA ligase 1
MSIPKNVKFVPTHKANNEVEVFQFHKEFTSEGFEGTMIRDRLATYEIGKRSYSLLKLKDFVDAEYQILDVIDGEGSDVGLAIFVLDNGYGKVFNCRPEGSQENRAELYKNRKTLINKFLTVRYQELSKDGVPIFPVGVGIRDEDDFK